MPRPLDFPIVVWDFLSSVPVKVAEEGSDAEKQSLLREGKGKLCIPKDHRSFLQHDERVSEFDQFRSNLMKIALILGAYSINTHVYSMSRHTILIVVLIQ